MPSRIRDVARLAGVSSATVSRVLANKPHVRESVRQRVLAAVEELDYQPSRVARSLRVQHSRIIGLIISDIQNPFFTSLVRAVEDIAYAHQHTVFLCNSDEDVEKERLYIDLLRAEKGAGVIITPTVEQNNPCQKLLEANIPVVSVDRRMLDISVDTVRVDNVGAAFKLVSHLIDHGHRRIGAVIGLETSTTGRERLTGYRQALQANKIPISPELTHAGYPNQKNGYDFTQALLALPDRPTGLFTGNNLLTEGALRAIHDQGLRIPEDIALVAFDEMDWMSLIKPQLTVIAQPSYELGKVAAELLLKRMEDKEAAVREIILEPTLIIRQSCAMH
jgi:DNA-binding LacI/PurR family transcriptional regulator